MSATVATSRGPWSTKRADPSDGALAPVDDEELAAAATVLGGASVLGASVVVVGALGPRHERDCTR